MNRSKRFIIVVVLFFSSHWLFAQEELSARELRENPEMQDEMFSAIVGDRELLNGFIEHLVQDTMAVQTLMSDEDFLGEVFNQAQMRMMKNRDPEMLDLMMGHLAQMIMDDTRLQDMMMSNEHMRQMIKTMMQKMNDGGDMNRERQH